MKPLFAAQAIAGLLFATTAWGSLFLVGKPLAGVLDPLWFTVLRYALATLLLAVLVQGFGRKPWAKLRQHNWQLMRYGIAGYGFFSVLNPLWFTVLRYALATLLLAALVQGFGRKPWAQLRQLNWQLMRYGIAGYGFFGVLCFYGLRLSAPSHGSVIMATMPFTTLGLRWVLDKQRPSTRAMVGAGAALIGVATVADLFGQHSVMTGFTLLGDALTLAGTLGWVLYTRGAATLPQLNPLEYTALTAAASLPWLMVTALLATAMGLAPLPSAQVLASVAPQMLYVAVVPTVAAAMAFNLGVRRLGAPLGTLFLNVVPLSVIVVRAWMGHAPQSNEMMGAALVASALVLNAWPVRSRPLVCRLATAR